MVQSHYLSFPWIDFITTINSVQLFGTTISMLIYPTIRTCFISLHQNSIWTIALTAALFQIPYQCDHNSIRIIVLHYHDYDIVQIVYDLTESGQNRIKRSIDQQCD